MLNFLNWMGVKVMAVIIGVLLVVIMSMGIIVWWLRGDLKDAEHELGTCTAQVTLLSDAIDKQNAAIATIGDKKKEADKRRAAAEKRAGKLKSELDKLKAELEGYAPDPLKDECTNAMDLIRKAKAK